MGAKKWSWHVGKKMIAGALALSMCVSNFLPGGGTRSIVHAAEKAVGDVICEWNFEDGTEQGWTSSDWSSASMQDMQIAAESGRLGLTLDFSGKMDGVDSSWVKAGIEQTGFSSVDFDGAEKITLDFYYEKDKKTQGELTIQAAAQDNVEWEETIQDDKRIVDITGNENLSAEEVDGGLLKTTVSFELDKTKLSGQAGIGKLVLIVVGKNTDYNGKVYFDNITITKTISNSDTTPTASPVATKRPYRPSYPVTVPTETPTATPEVTATPAPTATETPTATPVVTATPVPPTATPMPAVAPTVTPVPAETGKPEPTTEVITDDVTGAVKEITTTVNNNVETVVEKVTMPDGKQSIKESVTETSDGITKVTETINSSETACVLVKNIKKGADGSVIDAEAVIYTGLSELGSSYSGKNIIMESFLQEVKNSGISTVTLCIEKSTVDAVKESTDKKMVVEVEIPKVEGVSVEKVMLTKGSVSSAADSKQQLVVKVVNDDAKASYTVTIPQSELKKMKGDIDVTVKTGKVSELEKTKQNKINKVLSANGIGKKNASVAAIAKNNTKGGMTVSVPISSAKAGSSVYVYCYNEKTGKLEEIANSKSKVSGNGTVAFEGSSGKEYVVVSKQLKGKNVVSLLDKTKVSTGKTSVKNGGKTKITVKLPSELVPKSSLKKDVPYAKQAVVIKYKSSDTKVVKVSKDGTVKAVGKGNAIVTVTIKLADGKVKTVKKKIKVKR